MPIIDFHNHFYPPAYLDALRSGSSAVEVTIDEDGNPRIYYPAITTSPSPATATSTAASRC